MAQARHAISRGAEAIVLGCAGMSSLHQQLRDRLHVQVIDGVAAAVTTSEMLVQPAVSELDFQLPI